jgi:cytidylate kinase
MSTEETDMTIPTAHNVAGRNVTIKEGGVHFEGEMSGGTIVGRDQHITYGLTAEEVGLLFVEWKNVDQPVVWNGRIPYIGLSAFQESDAQFFFGRESLVDDLLQRVTEASFITIAGPSGSGKSSVARAGLFHALRQGRLPKSDSWRLATLLPGGNPLEQLAIAIERLTHAPGSGNHIRHNGLENPLALHEQIQTLLSDDLGQRFVLLVDQFEESFTQTKDEAVREAFIHLLTMAAQTEGSRAIVILSLRSDFISHCARYPELRELMSRQFQLVGAMEPHDLAKAITLPALEVGAEIDPALVSRIMTDMKGEPGALPLMSFALRDLFEFEAQKTEKGRPLDMTLPDYLLRGGVEEALERHANQVFANFTEEQRELAKAVFSRLIEIGQGRQDTRRTAVLSELILADREADTVRQVIDGLAGQGARLLTTGGGQEDESGTPTPVTVTIAHEKLIDAWPWLRRLVDDNRETIALQNQIAADAQAWAQEKDAGYLYRGGRLVQAVEWCDNGRVTLDPLSTKFLAESRRLIEQEAAEKEAAYRRQLWLARGLAGTAILILLMVVGVATFPTLQNWRLQRLARAPLVEIQMPSGSFFLEAHEVSNEQYTYCERAGVCSLPQDPTRGYLEDSKKRMPVEAVSAYQANQFCQWLGRRLPTVAEWKAAYEYGRLSPDPPHLGNSDGPVETQPVRPENPVEGVIYHLVGNVWEWTTSIYFDDDTEQDWDGELRSLCVPDLPECRAYHLQRIGGGADTDPAYYMLEEFRFQDGFRSSRYIGFRCAL